jgi:benzylsuccinate CoA-transferase BbsF subunit
MRGPLEGVRVVDFGWVWAGAVPGHLLADMGAEVIKIESLVRLDYMRQGRPIFGDVKDPEQNPMFQNVNRGKLSFRINMTNPQGASLLRDLIGKSDVVIENFTPGTLAKYGLGWDELKQVNRGLVMCSMSAVGQRGPLSDIRTYATMIAGLAGMDSMVGYSDERVLGTQSSYADPNASLHAAFAILAALWRRGDANCGEYIDLSQWEAAANIMGEALMAFSLHGRDSSPQGVGQSSKAPFGNYPAEGEDNWVAIAVETDEQWLSLLRVLSEPEWAQDERFESVESRLLNSSALDERLADETSKHHAGALAEALTGQGVPAAPLLEASDLVDDEHFRQRQLFQMISHPVLGEVPVYGLPWHIDGRAWHVERRAPLLGEHNEYVLSHILGLSPAQVTEMQAREVFD